MELVDTDSDDTVCSQDDIIAGSQPPTFLFTTQKEIRHHIIRKNVLSIERARYLRSKLLNMIAIGVEATESMVKCKNSLNTIIRNLNKEKKLRKEELLIDEINVSQDILLVERLNKQTKNGCVPSFDDGLVLNGSSPGFSETLLTNLNFVSDSGVSVDKSTESPSQINILSDVVVAPPEKFPSTPNVYETRSKFNRKHKRINDFLFKKSKKKKLELDTEVTNTMVQEVDVILNDEEWKTCSVDDDNIAKYPEIETNKTELIVDALKEKINIETLKIEIQNTQDRCTNAITKLERKIQERLEKQDKVKINYFKYKEEEGPLESSSESSDDVCDESTLVNISNVFIREYEDHFGPTGESDDYLELSNEGIT